MLPAAGCALCRSQRVLRAPSACLAKDSVQDSIYACYGCRWTLLAMVTQVQQRLPVSLQMLPSLKQSVRQLCWKRRLAVWLESQVGVISST